MKELYLSLGSNLGDREANIRMAIDELEAFLRNKAIFSGLMEYPSWGFQGCDFLNCVVRFDIPDCGADTTLFLTALIRQIKKIEAAQGREDKFETRPDGSRIYHNRQIDIDILFYGTEKLDTELLKVPHPLAEVRNFVLEPLAKVASETFKKDFPFYFQ